MAYIVCIFIIRYKCLAGYFPIILLFIVCYVLIIISLSGPGSATARLPRDGGTSSHLLGGISGPLCPQTLGLKEENLNDHDDLRYVS